MQNKSYFGQNFELPRPLIPEICAARRVLSEYTTESLHELDPQVPGIHRECY